MEESIWELPSPLLVKSEEHVHSVKLLVRFIVKKRYFIGTVAVEHVEIKNVQADKNVHDFVRTGFIFLKPWDQETKQWQEVPTLADLAITPAIHLVENPEWK